ncbi:MAG: IclR family transcriptional regulator [Acidobacteriaceae bacterium]|nr:IclR family transcriptional regulator [Acidobacteriaceae bacterium]
MAQESTRRSSAIPNGGHGAVSSVEKALRLLSTFSLASPQWALSDLAREQGMPKSTAHNLLKTLQAFDLVRQDPEDRVYRLGPRALEMGFLYARSTELLGQARPHLRRLAERSRETVKLGMLSDSQVLIVAAVESTHQLHTRGDIGTRWPLHSTGLGKAILSALPLAEAEALTRRRGLAALTKQTATSWPKLRAELAATRERGYAVDREENEAGVRCVAAAFVDPLRGAVAAVSVSGPSVRLSDAELATLGQEAVAVARAIRPHLHWEEL